MCAGGYTGRGGYAGRTRGLIRRKRRIKLLCQINYQVQSMISFFFFLQNACTVQCNVQQQTVIASHVISGRRPNNSYLVIRGSQKKRCDAAMFLEAIASLETANSLTHSGTF